MLSNKLLPIIAVLLVVAFVAPSYVQAAEYVDKTLSIEIESKYQTEHDEVVNVANESSIKNPDTWNPASQGIWIGASTEESLFEFDVVATADNVMKIASTVKFNRSQIMNGASEYIVRCPIASDDLTYLKLEILKFVGEAIYDINDDVYLTTYNNAEATLMASIVIDLADVSITSGSDAWTVDGRTYILVRCPIYSGTNYAFIWNAKLVQDSSFQVYVSGQDIANDNISETRVYYATEPVADFLAEYNVTLAIDPGISWDFLSGLGNGIYANSFYMETGDSIVFQVDTNSPFAGYQTLMVPFGTDSGTLEANITVMKYSLTTPTYLWGDEDTWTNYILACSGSDLTGTVSASVIVNITVLEDVRVNWIFSDSPTASIISYFYNQAVLNLTGVDHTVYSHLWYSYQESVAQIYPPSLDPADFPASMLPEVNQPSTWYGTIIGVILVVVGGVMIATGFLAPVGAVIAGIGTAMIIVDIAKGGNLIEAGTLPGWLENGLDKIRDFLSGIGEFLWSIGEGLWDALMWLADAIVEYGSILLGLLIIGVALVLFFVPIYAQLKLWGIVWSMAQGKLEKAVSQAQDLANTASSVAGRLK